MYFKNRDSISVAIQDMNTIYLSLLKNRNQQNDFFNIDVRNPEFYATHKSINLSELKKNTNLLQEKIKNLNQRKFISNSNFQNDIEKISLLSNASYHTFEKLTNALLIRGFKDEGVIGKMRANAHALENTAELNKATILMLRRHEKDFIIRNDKAYIEKFNNLANSFQISIKNNPLLSTTKKKKALLNLEMYRYNFTLMVSIETFTGLKDNSGLKNQLDELYNQIDRTYSLMLHKAEREKDRVYSQLELFYILYILILVAFSVLLAMMVSKLLSNPLRKVISYISHIRQSNFQFNPKLELKNSTHEVQKLYEEFSALIALMHQKQLERDLAEKNLRHNELKYREMSEHLPQSIFEANNDGIITYVNKTFTAVLGYTRNEVKNGLSLKQVFNCSHITNFYTQSSLHDSECKAFKTNNTEIPVVLYISQIVKNNKVLGIRGLLIDDTERRNYIHELEEARHKAEESDRLKSSFLANMSHEIRTPMNAILGFSNLLSANDLPQKAKSEYLGYIKSSGTHLLKLIDDIIDVAKIEAGELKINSKPCDINGLLDELKAVFENVISNNHKSIELEFNKSINDNEFSLITDEIRLKQILTNLIGNAIKFTNTGKIEVGYDAYGRYLQFYVRDTGIGIPQSLHDKIFERFSQVNTTSFGGTGLGLTITKNLVQLLGGKIWLTSEEGKGSTFFFIIPFDLHFENKKTLINHEIMKTEEIYLFGTKILIADDDDLNFLLLQKHLQKTGVKLLHAKNGKEAIAMSKKGVHLILMDMQMPGMNGYEATRNIKALNNSMPIIAQTASVLYFDKERCFEAGCDEYIQKPINREQLLSVIKKCLKAEIEIILN